MAGGVGLVFDDRYLQHDPGPYRLRGSGSHFPFAEPVPHPSSHLLAARTKELLDRTGLSSRLVRVEPRLADDADLLAYHTPAYLARVRAISDGEGGDTGQGARIAPGGEVIARLAAGGALAAVDVVMTGATGRAFALVRPPGHHAMADLGMGFCVYNNAVVAAQHARRAWGLQRILILDWDVHHGNGTQDAFDADPAMLFISLHQDQLYPAGWGSIEEVGSGAGVGFTVNIPLPAGSGDAAYLAAFDRLVAPIVRQFGPQLVLISAGQDASNADPLGRMCVTTDGYRAMTARAMAIADACCAGRLALLLEGGYAEWYAPYCTLAIFEALLGERAGIEEPFPPAWIAAMPPTQRVSLDAWAALERAHEVQRAYWSL